MEDWDWNQFLERERAKAFPENLFEHVENSILNGISPGMLVETSHRSNPHVYWIAEISLVCGHMLFLKFIGADEGFWCDITTAKVHPLGWCGKYDEPVEPPEDINARHGDSIIELMKRTLIDGASVSEEALNNKGMSPIDRIKPGMKLELQNLLDPFKYWIATVEENVGGRLLLKYDGSDDDVEKPWIFYGSPRLCGFGFVTNKGTPWQFRYPGKVNKFSCKSKLSAQLRLCAEESIKDPTPADLFEPKIKMETHNFITGMKLEALDPSDMKSIRPATVVKVFNCYHFLVVLDDNLTDYELTRMAWLCDVAHPYIYPVNWAASNSMPFTVPKIWDTRNEFDWDDYLTQTSSVPAPEYCFGNKNGINGIEVGMKLEAVNPKNDSEIHAASIFRIVEHMIGIELLSTGEKIWYADNSDQILPVGWCSTNNYPLHIPREKQEQPKEVKTENSPAKEDVILEDERCDRIYFNYKCYAGPLISRNKLSQLPKHVGPGPLSLVMKEVLNLMISASYKPVKLLKDWEMEGPAEPDTRLEMLKAKLKTSTHYAYVQVVTKREQVEEFCREMCAKMQACPHLFGPAEFPAQCPQTCQLVDKCTFQNGGNRFGRGRAKRRRKGLHFMTVRAQERRAAVEAEPGRDKDGDSGNESENSLASTPRQSESGTRPNSPDSGDSKKKRKRDGKHEYPKLEMKTRGAKLPNFARQMKEGHWNKKDVETMYSKTCVLPKKRSDSDSEESSRSTNSKNNDISDVSDNEEPELKKLRSCSREPQPSDDKLLDRMRPAATWSVKLNLPENPARWSIKDVHSYLSSTDCKVLAGKLREQEIDGPAFIMMNLPMILEFLHIRREYAVMLCKHVTKLKFYYIVNYQESIENRV